MAVRSLIRTVEHGRNQQASVRQAQEGLGIPTHVEHHHKPPAIMVALIDQDVLVGPSGMASVYE